MKEFEVGEIKTKKRTQYLPYMNKKKREQEKCKWCGRTDCDHIDR